MSRAGTPGFLGTGSLNMARCAATLLLSIARLSGLSISWDSSADGNAQLLLSGLAWLYSSCWSLPWLFWQLRDSNPSFCKSRYLQQPASSFSAGQAVLELP